MIAFMHSCQILLKSFHPKLKGEQLFFFNTLGKTL